MAQRVIGEGAAREGKVAADIGPDDARTLLEAWLGSVGVEQRGRELIDHLQSEGFSHADLYRRARRIHERRLRVAVAQGEAAARGGDLGAAVGGLFDAILPAVPYAPATAFLGAEKAKLAGPRRAAQGGADRRRDRRDARRHPHDRADPRARRPRLRGRGGRHRPRRRPPPAGRRRARGPLLRGDEARRARPARPGRDAGRGPLRPRPRHRARPGRRRRHPAQPGHRDAAARQLPHRARRLRRPAQRRRRGRGDRRGWRSVPSTGPPRWSSRRARRRTAR